MFFLFLDYFFSFVNLLKMYLGFFCIEKCMDLRGEDTLLRAFSKLHDFLASS